MTDKIIGFDKIFVTGIFGTGKTHFSKLMKPVTHTYISFDDNYSYQTLDLTRIYQLMNEHPKFIMDALPQGNDEMDRLKGYYSEHNCCIVLLKCDIDIWLERLKSKKWYNGSQLNTYKKNYLDFYNRIAKVVTPSFDNIFMYDSGEEVWLSP